MVIMDKKTNNIKEKSMKKIDIEDFCKLKYLSGITYAPDGKCAAVVVTDVKKDENKYESHINIVKDGKISKLTLGSGESSFFWEDNETIIFRSNRENKKDEKNLNSYFYRIKTTGGEAELAYTIPVPVAETVHLKSGNLLVTASVYPGYEDLYKGDKKRVEAYFAHTQEEADYEVITQNPWWWNGGTFIRGEYTSLYYYDVKKNRLTLLTDTGMGISNVKVDEKEEWAYFTQLDQSIARPEYFAGGELVRINLKTFEKTVIKKLNKDFKIHDYYLGESKALLLVADDKYGMNTDADFYTMDYDTLEIKPYLTFGQAFGSSVGSDVRYGGGRQTKIVGDTFYFVSTQYDSAKLYKLEDGIITCIIDKEGSIDNFDIYGDKILMSALWDMRPQELYDEKCKKVSSFNDKVMRGKYIAIPEILNFTTAGHEVHGFVLKPYDYEEGKKYPVIIDIHGGPKTVYGPVFYHEMQYWANLGYFVIYCNPTGSDGRGEYMDIRGKYGTVDYDDIMAFCDEALRAYPDMDAENFFETGGSYGGFMTNWIIGHTDRFKACASQRSISNWISFYGVSDIGVEFAEDQNDTTIWPSVDDMWWHSPLKYADKCKTPTLFIHSFEDYRCPIDQGYQMYTALVAHGIESKMVCFKGENHDLSRTGKPKHRIRRLKEITEWFENHRG